MPAEQTARKRVSVLFLDIVGSTALAERLDPEALRQIMDRYFTACAAVIAEHGGAVEKFIGDAILAVFGSTVAHEDDAVRAVRAAGAALAALHDLNAELAMSYQVELEARCGICTGDVVVVTMPGGDFRVIGDAVNTASRLQTAAGPGHILVDADTVTIVRSEIGLEPVPPLELKGKAHAVPAWRVTEPARAGPDESAYVAPLIGRAEELEELRQSLRKASRRRQVCLATVLGSPGIGKSRLVQEFVAAVPASDAIVLSGRCSAYGKGITYKPLAEMLRSFPGGWTALTRMLGEDSLAACTLATIATEPPADERDPAGVEDIAWAVRHLFDVLGQTRTVVAVWEDLHWSEQTLLDLIDDVASWLNDVPVLLLCVARTELLETRPGWGGGKPCSMTLELGPLSYEQSATLVSELVMQGDVYPQDCQQAYGRIAAQCEGNPLFAELMLDVLGETAGSVQIPPTIQSLLGARLDQLPADERTLLELAAVAGPECTRPVLEAMAAETGIGPMSSDLLARLLRRRILQRGAHGTLRFAQALLCDTAYAFTPKARRERWHEFLAQWFAGQRDAMATARHVEAACRLRRELRPGDAGLPRLAGTAAGTLIAEGMNALQRKDLPAAIDLLERGRALLAPDDSRHATVALHICDCRLGLWDADGALAALDVAETALAGDRRGAALCDVQRRIVALRLGLAPTAELAESAAAIEASLEADRDDNLSWCRLHQFQAYLRLAGENAAAADSALRKGLARAAAMKDKYEEDRLLCAICELAQWAPRPVTEGLDLCGTLRHRFGARRGLLIPVLVTQAHLTALAGDLEDARATIADARGYSGDLHLDLADAAVMEMSGLVESLAGAHREAEAYYRRSLDMLRTAQRAPDVKSLEMQSLEIAIARELFGQGRTSAAALALDQAEAGAFMSLRARIAAAALRGRIASVRGCHNEAGEMARDAQALSEGTDDLCLAGETLFDLAVVLQAIGRASQAATAGRQALRKFEAKGATLMITRVRAWLCGIGESGEAHE